MALYKLIIFLEDPVKCRHKGIMTYFGESRENFQCLTTCDNCQNRGQFQITDGTSDALRAVKAIVELTGKQLKCNTIKLFLCGSAQKIIKENNLDELATFGILAKSLLQ